MQLCPRLASAARSLGFFGGQLGIWDWHGLRDAHTLCPFSLGCQRHLLTLWMAALVPSRRAGRTDSQTTCFSEFVWKPAAAQPERGKLWVRGTETQEGFCFFLLFIFLLLHESLPRPPEMISSKTPSKGNHAHRSAVTHKRTRLEKKNHVIIPAPPQAFSPL